MIFKNGGTSMSIRSQKNVLISNTSFGFIFFFNSPVHPKKKRNFYLSPFQQKKPTPLSPFPLTQKLIDKASFVCFLGCRSRGTRKPLKRFDLDIIAS